MASKKKVKRPKKREYPLGQGYPSLSYHGVGVCDVHGAFKRLRLPDPDKMGRRQYRIVLREV